MGNDLLVDIEVAGKAVERLDKAEQKSRYATLFASILPVPEAL
jgi:hypothetical protein